MIATFPPPGVPVTAAFACGHCREEASEAEAVSYLTPGLLPEDVAAVFLASQSKDHRPVVSDHLQSLQRFLEAASVSEAVARVVSMSAEDRRSLQEGFREQTGWGRGSPGWTLERLIWLAAAFAEGHSAGRYGFTRFYLGGWDPVKGRDLKGAGWLAVLQAVSRADPVALLSESLELAPFYCDSCALSYCQAHWKEEVSFDEGGFGGSFWGTCPQGHRRVLQEV